MIGITDRVTVHVLIQAPNPRRQDRGMKEGASASEEGRCVFRELAHESEGGEVLYKAIMGWVRLKGAGKARKAAQRVLDMLWTSAAAIDAVSSALQNPDPRVAVKETVLLGGDGRGDSMWLSYSIEALVGLLEGGKGRDGGDGEERGCLEGDGEARRFMDSGRCSGGQPWSGCAWIFL